MRSRKKNSFDLIVEVVVDVTSLFFDSVIFKFKINLLTS